MFSSQLLASDRNIAGMKHFYLSSHPPILCGWITSGSRLSLYGSHEMSILFSALFYTTGSRIGTIPSVVYCKPNRLMDKHYLSQIHCSQFRLGCVYPTFSSIQAPRVRDQLCLHQQPDLIPRETDAAVQRRLK